jgi:predicted tellurium resistance membrane protein TerC
LLISVPIVIWGSTFVLKVVERHPSVVYVGAGVLAFTAVRMVTAEPLCALDAAHPFAVPLLYGVTIFGVLWADSSPITAGWNRGSARGSRDSTCRTTPRRRIKRCPGDPPC